MAVTFTITDGSNSIIFSNDTGFILSDGYNPAVAVPTGDGSIPPPVTEVIPCVIVPTSADNLSTLMQTFAGLQKTAAEYRADPTQATNVQLQCKLDAETGTRQALVLSMSIDFNARLGGLYDAGPVLTDGRQATITLVRHPYWERTTGRTFPALASTAGAVVTYDYSSTDPVGDVGARIDELNFQTAVSVTRYWMGLRSATKHGTLANFVPLWECEDTDFTLGTNAARDVVTEVNLASPGGGSGGYVIVTPGTATWAKRLTMPLDGVTANYTDNLGSFLWMLRARVTADPWEVYFRYGGGPNADDDALQFGQTVEISNTSWDYHTMDVVTQPPGGEQFAYASVDYNDLVVQIWARRPSGSGNLELDCVPRIPTDEGFCHIPGTPFAAALGAPANVYLKCNPKDWWLAPCAEGQAGTVFHSGVAIPSAHSFYLPVGDGRMYIVYARTASSVLTDVVSVINAGSFFERWGSLRGAE
jgi:hypothetical protein